MQFALAIFNVPVLQFALELQKKQFERKQSIGFGVRENDNGSKVYN